MMQYKKLCHISFRAVRDDTALSTRLTYGFIAMEGYYSKAMSKRKLNLLGKNYLTSSKLWAIRRNVHHKRRTFQHRKRRTFLRKRRRGYIHGILKMLRLLLLYPTDY